MNSKNVQTIIRNEPLFEGNISVRSLTQERVPSHGPANLFVGVGLCTAHEPAQAIPFDILSFFLLPELLRRKGIIQSTFFLIADTHAMTNHFMKPEMVTQMTRCMSQTAHSIVRSFRLPDFNVITASKIRKSEDSQKILNLLPHFNNQYIREEVFDLCWFAQNHNVRWKLGWTISNEIVSTGHDERFFDQEIRATISWPITFLYASAGRTFNPKKPKTSPYISVSEENRLLLTPQEKVAMKLIAAEENSPCFVAARNHLQRIVRLFEQLIIKIPAESLTEKIEFITRVATQEIETVV